MKNRLRTQETQIEEFGTGSIPALSTIKTSKLASNEAFFILEKKPVPKNVPTKSTYRKRFVRQTKPYKDPVIIRSKNGDWMVRYWYEYPERKGKFKVFQVRDGINYIHDLASKEKAADDLRRDILRELEAGEHDPFKADTKTLRAIRRAEKEIEEEEKLMLLSESVKWFLDQKSEKGKSKKTINGYEYHLNPFVEWCEKNNLTRIDSPTIDQIEKYLSERLEDDEWTARTYNNNADTLTTFFNYLVSKRKMPVNPIGKGMIERIKNTAERNKYYDREALEILLPAIKKKEQLRRFIRWTYYSCARGSELRLLKIKNVNLEIKKLSITAEIGKTGAHVGTRSIPICQELMDIITDENLKQYPAEWYVFGERGAPGPNPSDKAYFSKPYLQMKRDLNLDFRYTIYSFKHTRVVDLLMAGFDAVKVMHITGHTDYGSFQKYIRELGAVMDKQLTGKTLTLNI